MDPSSEEETNSWSELKSFEEALLLWWIWFENLSWIGIGIGIGELGGWLTHWSERRTHWLRVFYSGRWELISTVDISSSRASCFGAKRVESRDMGPFGGDLKPLDLVGRWWWMDMGPYVGENDMKNQKLGCGRGWDFLRVTGEAMKCRVWPYVSSLWFSTACGDSHGTSWGHLCHFIVDD